MNQAGDLTSSGTAESIVTDAVKVMGELTTLVNCAGVLRPGAFGPPSQHALFPSTASSGRKAGKSAYVAQKGEASAHTCIRRFRRRSAVS